MNFNTWNIKDMLSIPSGSGTTKSSNWNNNQTDCSALSDSQFLFGSQFCPENSETLSAPLDFGTHLRHPKQTQQNSLDSEPSIFTKYQTKPQLFGGDTKDEGIFSLPLPVGKSKGLLKQFEDEKKRATDKCDSETLYNIVSHVKESIHRLQTSVEKSEEHLSSRSQSILDSLETVAKTMQKTARVQSDLLFEAMQDKGNREQAILEIQKRFETKQAEFMEMKSNLKHLENLVAQQSKDFQQLCEQLGQLNVPGVLEEIKRLILVPRLPKHVKDSTSQTSPSLTQSLNFTRQEKYTSEESGTWQAQAPSDARNSNTGFLKPGEFGVWDEGAKSDGLQEETVLPAVGPPKGDGYVKKAITKISPKNHGSSIPGYKVCGDRDLFSQNASQLISQDLNNFATTIRNVCPKYQAQCMFSYDPCEQLVTEQKGRTVGRGRKGKKPQPKKAPRGRLLDRKQEQTPSKTYTFISKYQSPQAPMGQQESLAKPLHLWSPRSSTKSDCRIMGETYKPSKIARRSTKPVCHVLGGTASKTARAAEGSLLQFTRYSSQDNKLLSSSSQGDHQMSWFSDLNLEDSEPLLCKQEGKTSFYDLGFDSSDDDF